MTSKKRKRIGDVVQIHLPNGKYAYGRVYLDGGIGIYAQISDEPAHHPIGSRSFLFHVGIYNDSLKSLQVVGYDPFPSQDEAWPPTQCIRDPISGAYQLYSRGEISPSTADQCKDLEPVAAWNLQHIIERILGDNIFERSLKYNEPN